MLIRGPRAFSKAAELLILDPFEELSTGWPKSRVRLEMVDEKH
jgi:hypothetical protein